MTILPLIATALLWNGPQEVAAQVLKADYKGDRPELKRLYDKLGEFETSSRIRYWRGFAMWRRVVNGFNDRIDPEIQRKDAATAAEEFEAAIKLDPNFSDAKVGAAACLYLVATSPSAKPEEAKTASARGGVLAGEAMKEYPENPRFLWIYGASLFSARGEEAAIANYEKALTFLKKDKERMKDPLDPRWGEPELYMSLAWSYLHSKKPDLDAAERWAKKALALVPYWHYVKDILLPQIRRART